MIRNHKISIIYLLMAAFCLTAQALAETNLSIADHLDGNSTVELPSYFNNSDANEIYENISVHNNESELADEPINASEAVAQSLHSANSSQMMETLPNVVYEKVEPTAKSEAATRLVVKSLDNLSSGNYTTNISGMSEANVTASNVPKKAEVATYVYNDDDDSLDVSLYIDSVPKGKATVSTGEQQTFGNFTLALGFHRFKIVWEDPSPKKVYDSEQEEEIKGDDAVILYTTEHREPEKYDFTVSVKNENDKKITAYLYIDGIYQSDKEISESSTDDFSSVSVEEGTHDISLKWLDPYTNDEYEVKKRITIEGDTNIIFVSSKGTSFEDEGESINTTDPVTPDDTSDFNNINSTTATEITSGSKKEESMGTFSGSSNASGYSSDYGSINSNSTNNSAISGPAGNLTDNGTETVNNDNSSKTVDLYAIQTLSVKERPVAENKKLQDTGWEDISIVYPLVLLVAVFFVLRH